MDSDGSFVPDWNFRPYPHKRVRHLRSIFHDVPAIQVDLSSKKELPLPIRSSLSVSLTVEDMQSPTYEEECATDVSHDSSGSPSAYTHCSGAKLGNENPYYQLSKSSSVSVSKPRQNVPRRLRRTSSTIQRATDVPYSPIKGGIVRHFNPVIPWPYSGVSSSGQLSLGEPRPTWRVELLSHPKLSNSEANNGESSAMSANNEDQNPVEGEQSNKTPQEETKPAEPWYGVGVHPLTNLWAPYMVHDVEGVPVVTFLEDGNF